MTDEDLREKIERLRDGLDSGDRGGSEADRAALLQMSDNIYLVPSQIEDHRHEKILRHCTRMSEQACSGTDHDLVDALEDRDAAEQVVRWIHATYDNEHTNQDYRTALRSFGRYHDQRDEPPESLAWIPTGTSNSFDPVPSERDLLTYEGDIRPMIEAAQNVRDEALLAVQFEAGLRGGELYDLRVGDTFDGEHTTGIHVDGKEGERTVHLVLSTPYLQQWLDRHPAGDDDTAYLWSKLDDPGRPSYNTFLNYFKMAADRANVSKDVTPTAFRKSNTRWLVLQGFQQSRIEDRQGRQRGSKHTRRYMARFGEESNERAYARLHGLDVEAEADDQVGPIECPRCQRETPSDRSFCMWCHYALDYEAAETLDEAVDETVDALVASDSDAAQQMFGEFVKFLKENPHRLPDEAHDLVTSSDASS